MKRYTFFFICILFKMNAFAQEFKIDGGQLVLPAPIVFETGSDKIKAESEPTLEYIKKFLQAKDYITLLRIEGHTNNVGNEQKNQELSEKRAMAIAKNLVAKGIDCKRLIAVGFGSSKPIAQNTTPEGRAQNVRYEMRMAALRGRAIGGMPVDGGGKVAGDTCK